MKIFQRLCAAAVFLVVLTSATLAGEISTPGIAQPTPTPTPASSSVIAAGEMPIGASTSEIESSSFTGVAFDLLQIMLSVF
jgi:hypothetical protein